MKKYVIAALLTAFILQPSIVTAAPGIYDDCGTISASSEITKEVMPDTAFVTLTVQTSDKKSDVASLKNKEIMQKIKQSITAMTNSTNKIEMTTTNFSLRPDYSYNRNNVRNLIGYTVRNSVNIKTKDIENLGKIVDAGFAAGATEISGIDFKLEQDASYCNDLLYQVSSSAYKRAASSARALNQSIKGIKSMSTHCSFQSANGRYTRLLAKSTAGDSANEAASEPETQLTPGKTKINASVNATFYVK